MADLAEFVLARIAEDEAAAREAVILDRAYPDGYEISYTWMRQVYEVATRTTSSTNVLNVRAPSPDHVLAECEAKRRIVDAWAAAERAAGSYPGTLAGIEQGLDVALSFLALPYADHPDYREEWKP